MKNKWRQKVWIFLNKKIDFFERFSWYINENKKNKIRRIDGYEQQKEKPEGALIPNLTWTFTQRQKPTTRLPEYRSKNLFFVELWSFGETQDIQKYQEPNPCPNSTLYVALKPQTIYDKHKEPNENNSILTRESNLLSSLWDLRF